MYVDGLIVLIIYVFSTVSALVSLYVLWIVSEIRDEIHELKHKSKPSKTVNAWDHYHNKAQEDKSKSKSFWA